MFTWLAANAATIVISAVLLGVVVLIVRGMLRGRIKTCDTCGACGSGCSACQFGGQCAHSPGREA